MIRFFIYFSLICFSDFKANLYSERAKMAEKDLEPISCFRTMSGVVKAYDPEKNIAYYARMNNFSMFNLFYIYFFSASYYNLFKFPSYLIASKFENVLIRPLIYFILLPIFVWFGKFILSPALYLTADSWTY